MTSMAHTADFRRRRIFHSSKRPARRRAKFAAAGLAAVLSGGGMYFSPGLLTTAQTLSCGAQYASAAPATPWQNRLAEPSNPRGAESAMAAAAPALIAAPPEVQPREAAAPPPIADDAADVRMAALTPAVAEDVPPPARLVEVVPPAPPMAAAPVITSVEGHPKPPSSRPRIFAQFASFSDQAGAHRSASALDRSLHGKLKGFSVHVVSAEVREKTVWRVVAGPLPDVKLAKKLCAEVKHSGGGCSVSNS